MADRPRVRTQEQVQRRLDKARSKAHEQARLGNLPYLMRSNETTTVFNVHSRTSGGAVYTVTLDHLSGESTCDCDAPGWCWHRSAVECAMAGEIGSVDTTRRPLPRTA